MNWDDIKVDRDLLLELLKEYSGQRPLARELGIDHKTIKYWMEKYDIEVEDYLEYSGSKEGHEERNYKYNDFGGYYLVYRKAKGSKPIKITKEKLREFKSLYCGDSNITLRKCSLELDIPRNDLHVIKTAFAITHDDIEFIDDDIEEKTDEELIKISKERRKRNLIKKIEDAKYKKALKENEKYNQKDYFLNKATDKIMKSVDSFEWKEPLQFYVKDNANSALVVNLTDWHFGKLVLGEWLLGDIEGFNKKIFQERIDEYLIETIDYISQNNVEELLVLNYGDGLDDPNGEVYPNQYDHQDIKHEEQFLGYVDSLQYFLLALYDYLPYIRYSAVKGNHSRGGSNWDLIANKVLKRMLSNYDSIDIEVSKQSDKIVKVYDSTIIQTHGNNFRKGKYTGHIDVLNMIRLAKVPSEKVYVVQGHLHHLETLEGVGFNWYKLPSLVGGDILSTEKMHTGSRPAQALFLIEKEKGLTDTHFVYFD